MDRTAYNGSWPHCSFFCQHSEPSYLDARCHIRNRRMYHILSYPPFHRRMVHSAKRLGVWSDVGKSFFCSYSSLNNNLTYSLGWDRSSRAHHSFRPQLLAREVRFPNHAQGLGGNCSHPVLTIDLLPPPETAHLPNISVSPLPSQFSKNEQFLDTANRGYHRIPRLLHSLYIPSSLRRFSRSLFFNRHATSLPLECCCRILHYYHGHAL